ncbi:MAG TPA: hypothetical protein VLM84_07910 [Chromatiaceae bacterium]|jgi:hypothetical protein|nr:hypothetical protein [Chromatiaceae bacterium]
MFQVHSIRIATVAALGVFLVLWGNAQAAHELKAGTTEALEVKVLEAQVPPVQGERQEVLYRMEVISVLRSSSRVNPGDTITVRSYALGKEPLAPGWIGVANLNPDPKAGGSDARSQFIATQGDSFEDVPPGPPSLRFTPSTPQVGGPTQ